MARKQISIALDDMITVRLGESEFHDEGKFMITQIETGPGFPVITLRNMQSGERHPIIELHIYPKQKS